MKEDKLNDYVENSKNLPREEDKDFLRLINDFKSANPNIKPDQNFSEKLQAKITNEFKGSLDKLPSTSSGQSGTYREKKTMEKVNLKIVWGFGAMAALIIIAVVGVLQIKHAPGQPPTNQLAYKGPLPQFASCSALTSKLEENYNKGVEMRDYGSVFGLGTTSSKQMAPVASSEEGTAASTVYSQTNIQVAGVDEADIVKTDGKYIYTVSSGNIYISQAYPVADAKLLGKIEIKNGTPSEIFIDGENLLVFGSRNENITYEEKTGQQIIPPSYYQNLTFVEIYNLKDPANPVLRRKLEFEGSYNSSRKIDNYVYFVMNSYPDYRLFETNTNTVTPQPVPLYRDQSGNNLAKTDQSFTNLVGCADVAYIDPIVSNQYLTVVGLPIDDYNKEIAKEVILGSSENIYASTENLYIANTTWQYAEEPSILERFFGGNSEEKTNIYKFSLNKDKIKYQGQASVPGTILNQFSMDEYNDYFRIATTIGYVAQGGGNATNNVYILDKNLQLVGSLTGIAPGEKFYSTRFIGDRAYLVTFQKVDPFFTVDLADPKNPKILGKLKIPGFSDYLHPYDENHIIGIGKETVEAEGGGFSWYQGMKMAIFDVTDVANPKELHKVVIGDRGTDSPILTDHKAFLFSKDKNLLVIPITLAEIPEAQKTAPTGSTYGSYVYQGSYVYNITLDKGFELKGRITHYTDEDVFQKSGYYYGGSNLDIKRNLYIDDSLYSISNGKIMINALADLNKQGEITLTASSQSGGGVEEPQPGI